MTEREKWKDGQPFDSAKLWTEMEDETVDELIDVVSKSKSLEKPKTQVIPSSPFRDR